jgi:hypothetical protein
MKRSTECNAIVWACQLSWLPKALKKRLQDRLKRRLVQWGREDAICDALSTTEGRKALAKAMIEGIAGMKEI